jgi:membrane peptidoglycan carboxypeptidase
VRGTLRAAVYLGKKGGASTITQQLAKMLFTDRRRTFVKRTFQKFQEWIISARLERQYTKDEIIAMYLNRFDWINQAVGINSAARVYFNTTPDSLNVEEAAMLVGMCKNPALFNPLRQQPDTTLTRRMVVLDQMRKNGFLTTAEYDSLKALPIGLQFPAGGPYRRTRAVLPRSVARETPGPAGRERTRMAATAMPRRMVALRHLHRRPEDLHHAGPPHAAVWRVRRAEHLGTELQARLLQGHRQEEEPALRFPREQRGDRWRS